MINARLDAKDFIEDYKIKASRFPKATNSAINEMASQTKTLISKEIRSTYNIKSKDLNKSLKLKRSTWQTMSAELIGYGKGIPIKQFGATSNLKTFNGYKRYAVSAKIKKSGSKKLIPGAFGLKGNLKTVMKRTGQGRMPIKVVYGPGVANMFNDKIKEKANLFIREKFDIILQRNIEYMNK